MGGLFNNTLTVFLAFFAIMNPIANTAIFVSLVGDQAKSAQRAIAFKALLIAFIIICAFALLGSAIFHLFGITLPALRIAGGIIVFMIGYAMLHGERSRMHGHGDKSAAPEDDSDVAVSPLAVPILAGPGTIATAMNFSAVGNWEESVATVIAFFVISVITFICFSIGPRMTAALGESGMKIVTRLMGLILAVIGVQMLLDGIDGALKVFGKS